MVKVPQEIPNEITREIFSYASLPLRVNRAGEFPWYLGHVCPAWRDVFLSMQLHFWSEIQIEWPDLFRHGNLSKYTERIIDILNFFLRCGQQSPFSFRLYNARFHLEEEAPFDQVLSILAQESKRWQRALLRLWPSHVPALYRVKDSLPRLEYLDLVVWNPHSNGNESALLEPYLDLFETAPLLTQVKLEGSVWWEFDWSTLVSLQMTAKDIGEAIYVALCT
ncbi:hypothetical protein APHAL10511_000844 [Amanita phalloides]|nr:hypothetical protein APHAL10511_000844 [Amanita phalloides]